MKLVIDIDDEQVLFDIKNQGLEAETDTDKVIINALYNGTPLPKGHGDLISKEQAIDLVEFYQLNPQHFDFVNLIDEIKCEKPIIEADKEASDG